jgi:hypothetical protein
VQLTSITYNGNDISSIAPSAMMNTIGLLHTIEFPKTLTSIGEYAFGEFADIFPRIANVNFNELTNLKNIDKYAFYNSL